MRDSWPLTGRDEESGVIAELLDDDGYDGIVLAGGAGVGKTRLAHEAATAAAASGWAVRYVAATATGSSVPLGAFAQWVDDPDGAPLMLTRKVIDALTATGVGTRVLVLVDDAHLLDELSALVVHQLVLTRAAKAIVTLRSGRPVADAVTSLWKERRLQRLELQPLSHGESDELLGAVLGQPPDRDYAERLWALTQGNVLFLRHLVEHESRTGRPEVSPSLIELVEGQIGAIPAAVRDVVDLIAVAEPVDRDCLAALADPLAIEEAEQRELIRTADDAVYVGHPMYAEVRLNQCGPLRLRRLRGLVAAAMTDSGGANAVRRGLLWMDSDLAPDPDVLTAAATAASSLLDFPLAERLSRAAADSGVGVQARVDLAYSLLMQRKGDDVAVVIDSIPSAEVPATAFINDVILRAANLLWTMRSPDRSWQAIDEALEDAVGARVSQLLAFRANQLALAGRPAEVMEVMARVDYDGLDGFGATIGLCAETLALGELGHPERAAARAAECHRVVESSQQSGFLGQPLAEFHVFALTVAGDIANGVEVAEAHMRSTSEKPATARSLAEAIVGMAALSAGDLTTALKRLPLDGAADGSDFVLANSFYRFQLLRAQVLARLGDVGAAEEALKMARLHQHPTYVYIESTALLAEAWLAAARQSLTEARQFARQAAEFARRHGQLAREVLCLQTATQLGDTTVAGRLDELAVVVGGPRAPLAARYARAVQLDNAEQLGSLSVEFEKMGDLLAAADAAGQASASHRRAGSRGSAMTASSRVDALASACGGATSPAIALARLAVPFTRREHEIALLVARGLSNREIADAVSLSIRTIEGHIYRASCKVGTTRRSELAGVIRDLTTFS